MKDMEELYQMIRQEKEKEKELNRIIGDIVSLFLFFFFVLAGWILFFKIYALR